MNSLVLIKQVPDTGLGLRVSQEKLEETGLKWVLSPYDEFALEEALKLKASLNGKVFALSLGPARVKESLLNALALGADEAYHLKHEASLQDPLAIAQVLKETIQNLGDLSLIFAGKMAADQNNFAVPQMLAQLLNWSFVTNINSLDFKEGAFQVVRECGGGIEEVLKAFPPLVLSADKGLNQPRYPSLPGIMRAKKKPFHTIDIKAVEEKFKLTKLELPPQQAEPKIFTGDPSQQVKELLNHLRDKEKIL